jgi:hypothetical protein
MDPTRLLNMHAVISISTVYISLVVFGLVARVYGCWCRGPGFDSQPYQIFQEVGGLERGPLSLVRTIEELLEW